MNELDTAMTIAIGLEWTTAELARERYRAQTGRGVALGKTREALGRIERAGFIESIVDPGRNRVWRMTPEGGAFVKGRIAQVTGDMPQTIMGVPVERKRNGPGSCATGAESPSQEQ